MHERILVTGGAGFVGSSVALALKRSYPQTHVTAFDNLHRRGSELNLGRLREADVAFVHGDIRSLADLTALGEAPDLIVECSAEPSAQAGYGGSPEYLIDTNLTGCYHCLELARRVHADFVFISTSRVYPYRRLNDLAYEEGPERFHLSAVQTMPGASGLGVREEFSLDGPRSLYGMTKLAGELMVTEYADAYGIRCLIDRCGLLTGPWQMAKSDQGVIALWMAAHYFRRNLAYIGFDGSGRQVRDYLHIDDFCDLLLEQIGNFEAYAGRLFNVGGGLACSLSLQETTRLCEEITGNHIAIAPVAETRPADVRIYLTDHRRLTAVNGWRPRRDARATLGDIYEWIRQTETQVRYALEGGL
ncbi:MAG TPA: NAD-dependent epimerase/dehydratase family protein [Bryobacteraceae bacterium]|jgi:CDP-paratose 2-epimerase|nr:NAD-dependent epimerase/dehydratase family protein [Bryobacteraceae bacterium]